MLTRWQFACQHHATPLAVHMFLGDDTNTAETPNIPQSWVSLIGFCPARISSCSTARKMPSWLSTAQNAWWNARKFAYTFSWQTAARAGLKLAKSGWCKYKAASKVHAHLQSTRSTSLSEECINMIQYASILFKYFKFLSIRSQGLIAYSHRPRFGRSTTWTTSKQWPQRSVQPEDMMDLMNLMAPADAFFGSRNSQGQWRACGHPCYDPSNTKCGPSLGWHRNDQKRLECLWTIFGYYRNILQFKELCHIRCCRIRMHGALFSAYYVAWIYLPLR